MDSVHIPSDKTQGETAQEQLQALAEFLQESDLLLRYGYYASVAFVGATAGLPCDLLARFAKNRVLYRPAPPRTGKRGAPRKDGAIIKCTDLTTHRTPDGCGAGEDAHGHELEVECWHDLHFKKS